MTTISHLPCDALALAVDLESLPAADVVSGEPSAGALELAAIGESTVGIWDMTPGTATDTEVDEIFLVLRGRGQVEFLDPPADPIDLQPGVLVRLSAGMRTRWTITEPLRKFWVA